MDKIPAVDLDPVMGTHFSENKENWTNLAKKIRESVGKVGFMQVVNHGIPQTLIKKVVEINKKFFALDEKVKLKYSKSGSLKMDSYYGYSQLGQLAFGKGLEFRETYDWIEGRGTYPDDIIPTFSSDIEELHKHCKNVAKTLLRLFAIGLELNDEDFFIKRNKHWDEPENYIGITNIKLVHYPKISEEVEIPPNAVRIGEHTDFITITLLFQDDVGGLEAKAVNGEWIPVQPLTGGIVVNTGDLLEYWTSGIFQATPHRVLIPTEASKRAIPRYSVAFFNGPDVTETVTPLDIKKTPEEEQRILKLGKHYPSDPVNAYEHVFRKVKSQYN